MKNLIHTLDVFSLEPKLRIDGKKTLGSIFGVILSIIISSSSIVLAIFFIKDCTDRFNYRLTSSDVFLKLDEFYSLKNISISIEVKDGVNNPYPEFERYFTLEYLDLAINKQLEMKKCEQSFCLPNRDINTKRYGLGGNHIINIRTCLNETDEMIKNSVSSDLKTVEQRRSGCYSKEAIQKRLGQRGMYAYIQFYDHGVNHSSIDNIFPIQSNRLPFRISTELFSRYQLKFKPIIYNLDLGYILENSKQDVSFSYTGFDMQIAPVNKDDLSPKIGQIDIILDNYKTTFNRSYMKLQEVSANIGGIAKFLLLCGQLLIYLYNENNFYNILELKLLNSNKVKSQNLNLIEEFGLKKNNLKFFSDYRMNQDDKSQNLYNNSMKDGISFIKKSSILGVNNNCNSNLNLMTSSEEIKISLLKKKFKELNSDLNCKSSGNLISNQFCPSKEKLKNRKIIDSIISFDILINSFIELLQFKDYIVSENQLIYFGNQKLDLENEIDLKFTNKDLSTDVVFIKNNFPVTLKED